MLLLTAFSRLIVHPHWLLTSKPHPEEGNKLQEKTVGPCQPDRQKTTVRALYCCKCEVAGIFFTSGAFSLIREGTSKGEKIYIYIYRQYIKSIGDQINVKPLFLSTASLLRPLNSLCSHWDSEWRNTVKSLKRGGGASTALWLADYSNITTVLTNHVCKWSANRLEWVKLVE